MQSLAKDRPQQAHFPLRSFVLRCGQFKLTRRHPGCGTAGSASGYGGSKPRRSSAREKSCWFDPQSRRSQHRIPQEVRTRSVIKNCQRLGGRLYQSTESTVSTAQPRTLAQARKRALEAEYERPGLLANVDLAGLSAKRKLDIYEMSGSIAFECSLIGL
jgi:hypothetical protein